MLSTQDVYYPSHLRNVTRNCCKSTEETGSIAQSIQPGSAHQVPRCYTWNPPFLPPRLSHVLDLFAASVLTSKRGETLRRVDIDHTFERHQII